MARRGELVDSARRSGDPAAAQRIARLRKPTVSAWLVNALVIEDPSIVAQLADLGAALRSAQDNLKADTLRELSTQRRQLVAQLTTQALRRAQRADPPASLRDEVSGTFDAAVADADIAAHLGQLQRAQQWSGFGFAAGAVPELTLVQGGRGERRPSTHPDPGPPVAPKASPSQRRARQRAVTAARKAFDAADADLERTRRDERALDQQVRALVKKVAKAQTELDRTRERLEDARKAAVAARAQRVQTRSALDRAEHDAAH